MNQDQKKQKLAHIKQKIKNAAPAAIAWTSAAASVALVIYSVKKVTEPAKEFEPFREVTGEEKSKLLVRDDIVIQEADPGTFYFISVVPQENNTES